MTGIVANAMFLQKGHHPAPLLKPSAPAVPAALLSPPQPPARVDPVPPPVAPTPAPIPVAPVAPAPAAPVVRAVAKQAVAAPKPAVPKSAATSHVHKATAAPHSDSIGALIGTLGDGAHKAATGKPADGTATSAQARNGAKPAAHLAKTTAVHQD